MHALFEYLPEQALQVLTPGFLARFAGPVNTPSDAGIARGLPPTTPGSDTLAPLRRGEFLSPADRRNSTRHCGRQISTRDDIAAF